MTSTLVLAAQLAIQFAAIGGPPREPVILDPSRVHITPLGLEVLSGQGDDPFKLAADRTSGALPAHERGDSIFWRSLEMTGDASMAYGLSWDELYRIDAIDGSSQLIGKIELADAVRAWFGGPVSIDLGPPGVLPPERWLLRAKVEIGDPDLESLYAVDINTGGELDLVGTNALLATRIFTAPGGASATLVVELADENLVTIELTDVSSVGEAFVGGVFAAILPPGEGDEAVRLPLAGISRSPVGDWYGLSEGEWDPYGSQGLYAITTNGDQVTAARLTDVDTPDLFAIEFLTDGTLMAAGNRLYELDEVTGATAYIGTTGATIVDLDDAPDGRLYGTTFDVSAPSQLVDLTPGIEPLPSRLLLPEGHHWGLAVHQPKYKTVQLPTGRSAR